MYCKLGGAKVAGTVPYKLALIAALQCGRKQNSNTDLTENGKNSNSIERKNSHKKKVEDNRKTAKNKEIKLESIALRNFITNGDN